MRISPITLLALALVAAPCSFGAIIAYDGFGEYAAGARVETDGDVQLDGGTGWSGSWNVLNGSRAEVTIAGSGLDYTGGMLNVLGGDRSLQILPANGSILELVGRAFPSQSDTVYLSFLYNNSVDVGESSSDFLQAGFRADWGNPLVSALDRNTTFQARLTTSGSVNYGSGITSATGETYFLVLRADKLGGSANYNHVQLYVNPTSFIEAENAIDAQGTSNSGLAAASMMMIRRAFNDPGDAYLMDEFQVSTTFAEAVHAPEPASLTLLLAGAALLRRRRR